MSETAALERFLASVEALRQGIAPELSPLQAGVLASSLLGVAQDSRTFARVFGIAHALVLRAMNEVCAQGLLDLTARDARTQRAFWRLSAGAEDVMKVACGPFLGGSEDHATNGRRRPCGQRRTTPASGRRHEARG